MRIVNLKFLNLILILPGRHSLQGFKPGFRVGLDSFPSSPLIVIQDPEIEFHGLEKWCILYSGCIPAAYILSMVGSCLHPFLLHKLQI